jgi:type I restriction enzyme S subunit
MSELAITDIAIINPPLTRMPKPAELISFVSMSGVREGGGIAESTILPFRAVSSGFTRFQNGDVLFAKITPCMENGKGALVENLTGGVGCGSTEFHVLRATHAGTPGYLYHLMQWKQTRQTAELFMSGSAGQQRVQSDFFRRFKVYAPVLPVQKKIATVLTGIDTAIEKTEALIAKFQQIKAGLMHDLFTRGVLPNGQLRTPREQAPELYQETAIGWIPRGWAVRNLGSMARIVSGVTLGPKESGFGGLEVPYLRVANVQDGYLDLTEIKTVRVTRKELEQLRLQVGDVLMNEGGDFDKLGRGAVWSGEMEDCVHQNHVFRVRTESSRLLPYFLAFYSESSFGKKYFLISSKQSTNLASINSTQLNAYPIALPSREEQQSIISRISAANARIERMKGEAGKLRNQKSGLMHDLLTGKVLVNIEDEATTTEPVV